MPSSVIEVSESEMAEKVAQGWRVVCCGANVSADSKVVCGIDRYLVKPPSRS